MPPLHHAIFTHAAADDGHGFRDVYVAPEWPRRDQERLGRWLRSLRPQDAGHDAFATNAFRLDGTVHAVLARAGNDFTDEHGRPGLFVHALLTPLDEHQPPGRFLTGLLEASEELRDQRTLVGRLERCRSLRSVATTGHGDILKDPEAPKLDRLFLGSFLYAVGNAAGDGTPREFVTMTRETDIPWRLAAATQLLPPRLRLACRWAIGLRSGDDLSVLARPAGRSETLTPVPGGQAADYVKWLLERQRLGMGAGEVTDNWQIRSWDELLDWIQRD